MRILSFLFFLLFFSSCNQATLSNWFDQVKEYSLSQLASSSDKGLNSEHRQEILYLFGDLRDTDSADCRQIQYHIENNIALQDFEKSFELPRGFLFDEFKDFDYEVSLIKRVRTVSETAAFTVVNLWKTKVSLEDIKEVILKVRGCYPKEYEP